MACFQLVYYICGTGNRCSGGLGLFSCLWNDLTWNLLLKHLTIFSFVSTASILIGIDVSIYLLIYPCIYRCLINFIIQTDDWFLMKYIRPLYKCDIFFCGSSLCISVCVCAKVPISVFCHQTVSQRTEYLIFSFFLFYFFPQFSGFVMSNVLKEFQNF